MVSRLAIAGQEQLLYLWIFGGACPVSMRCDINITEEPHAKHCSDIVFRLPHAIDLTRSDEIVTPQHLQI